MSTIKINYQNKKQYQHECERCHHEWETNLATPRRCPCCTSKKWYLIKNNNRKKRDLLKCATVDIYCETHKVSIILPIKTAKRHYKINHPTTIYGDMENHTLRN